MTNKLKMIIFLYMRTKEFKLSRSQKIALEKWLEQTGEKSVSIMDETTYNRISNMKLFENFDTIADRYLDKLYVDKYFSLYNIRVTENRYF